nr:hypothetical protein [Tanacetum cinerariifolium]
MECGFLSRKGVEGGGGVKEKQQGVNEKISTIGDPSKVTVCVDEAMNSTGDQAKQANVFSNDDLFSVSNSSGNSSGGSPDVEDLKSVPIWVKFHDIPIVAFTVDGLSELKENMVIAIPNVKDDGEFFTRTNVGSKFQVKPKKPISQVVFKKNSASSSGTKKNSEVYRKVMSFTNPFDALNTIEEGDELGSNEGSSNSGKKIVLRCSWFDIW